MAWLGDTWPLLVPALLGGALALTSVKRAATSLLIVNSLPSRFKCVAVPTLTLTPLTPLTLTRVAALSHALTHVAALIST